MRVYLAATTLVFHLLAFSYCTSVRTAPAWPSVPPFVEQPVAHPATDPPVLDLPQEVDQPVVAPQEVGYRVMRVRVRAYTPWDPIDRNSPYRDGLTATLKDTSVFPNQWGIAACPTVFPYGTRIEVPGYNPSVHFPADHRWVVDDTGAVIRRHARRWRTGAADMPLIEVRFIHLRSARKWGDQVLDVRVYE